MTDAETTHEKERTPWWVPFAATLSLFTPMLGLIAAFTAGLWTLVGVVYLGGHLLRLLGPASGGLSVAIASAIMLSTIFVAIVAAVLAGRTVMRAAAQLARWAADGPAEHATGRAPEERSQRRGALSITPGAVAQRLCRRRPDPNERT